MRIKTIAASGIKLPRFKHDLEPVTVFVGKSEAGKTAAMDALLIALLGYHPKLGKRNSDTFKLARGSRMEAGAALDDGRTLARYWQAHGKHGELSIDTGASADCDGFEMPAMLFDVNQYFALSAKERLNLIFSLCQLPPEEGAPKILADLRGLRPEPSTEDTEAAIKEVIDHAADSWRQAEEEAASFQDWIALLLKELGEQLKAARASIKDFGGLVTAEAQLRAARGAGPVENVETELSAHREALAALELELKRAEDGRQARATAEAKLAAVRKQLESLP